MMVTRLETEKRINPEIVGLPLCRDRDYLNHCVEFSTKASRCGATIDIFPTILKPYVCLGHPFSSTEKKTLRNWVLSPQIRSQNDIQS